MVSLLYHQRLTEQLLILIRARLSARGPLTEPGEDQQLWAKYPSAFAVFIMVIATFIVLKVIFLPKGPKDFPSIEKAVSLIKSRRHVHFDVTRHKSRPANAS